jgi:hypothetical protein
MARILGQYVFNSNFEPQISAPLDSRMLVDYQNDLYLLDTWISSDGSEYTYKGMIVSVCNDISDNNGLYQLIDIDYTNKDNWIKIGSGTSASVLNGSVFITDINPVSTLNNIGSKIYSSEGNVLDSCVSDTNNIVVSILAVTGCTNYIPVITLKWGDNSQIVSLTETTTRTVFTGTVSIDLDNETSLTVVHEDGAKHTTIISEDNPPVINSLIFTGGYPGSQTELKSGDIFSISITTDLPIVNVDIANYGAYIAQTISVTLGTTTVVSGTIADRGTTVKSLGAKVRVQKSTGTWSSWYLTETAGSINGVNLLKLNNIYPSINISSITYPKGQLALKGSEVATIVNTISDYNIVSYTSPNGDLIINNSSIYEGSKIVARKSGSYNISTNNFTLTATRTANNAISSNSTIVNIANVAASLNVSIPYSRLRSGGNDGTAVQNYAITIISDQSLYSAPTLDLGSQGYWLGDSFTGSETTWVRYIAIEDDMTKGSYSFGTIYGKNLSGIESSVNSGTLIYTIGGFVPRTVTLDAFENEVLINTEVTNYANLAITWNVKSLPNKRAVGSTDIPDANSWTINKLNSNPTKIIILDTSATTASSVPTTITIQETV